MKNIVYTKEQLKQKTASGAVFLISRRFIYQLILSISNIIIARIFQPNIIGTFGIISFIILNMGIFTNFGLTQAFIQKNEKTTKNELKTIFSILVLAAIIFILIIYFIAPFIGNFYRNKLELTDIYWLRIFAIYILFINVNSITQGILEKKLAYKQLAIGDLICLFLSQALIIVFSFLNLGIGSFVLGNIAGAFIGMCVLFYIQPWSIGFDWNYKNLKPYLNFGFNYQLSSLVSAINAAVVPVFVGFVSGPAAVAYIMIAGGLRQGVIAITEVFQRLSFTISSRTSNNRELLKTLIEKMIKFSCLTSFPLLAIAFALSPNFITIIYTPKWMPMLPALYLSLGAGIFLVLSNLFIQFLLSLGKAKTVRNIYIFWAVMQWILTIPLVIFWNYNGAVLANLIVSATFFIPLIQLKKEINFNIAIQVIPYLSLSILTFIFVFLLGKVIMIESLIKLILIGGCGLCFYIILVLIFEQKKLHEEVSELIKLTLMSKPTHEKI